MGLIIAIGRNQWGVKKLAAIVKAAVIMVIGTGDDKEAGNIMQDLYQGAKDRRARLLRVELLMQLFLEVNMIALPHAFVDLKELLLSRSE